MLFRSMTQAALDAAYDQAAYAANREEVLGRYASNSAAVRGHLGEPTRYEYGEAVNEALDVFGGDEGAKAPINIFIHGGAWRSGRAADYAFPAALFVGVGARFVVPDFDLVQDRDGDLMPIADQIGARSPGPGTTLRGSVATATGSTSPPTPRAPI